MRLEFLHAVWERDAPYGIFQEAKNFAGPDTRSWPPREFIVPEPVIRHRLSFGTAIRREDEWLDGSVAEGDLMNALAKCKELRDLRSLSLA